jgi:hypothetical protein
MAFSPDFSASQDYGSPSVVTITNTSTGSDSAIVSRRLYFEDANSNYLVPEDNASTQYIAWSLSDNSIACDILDKDYALLVVAQWLDVSGTVLYQQSYRLSFTVFNENFDFLLSQMISANNPLINDNNFFGKKSLLRTFIDSGDKAVSRASDILTAQLCYDEATNLRSNAQYFFNSNS